MKTIKIGLMALALTCLVMACSTPSDAIEDTYAPTEEMLSPEALAVELAAKMANSPWVEQTERVTVAFGCTEGAVSYVTFEVVERVHKIFASNNMYYFVVGEISVGDSRIMDAAGHSYTVDFVVDEPAPLTKSSSQLYQHVAFALTGQGYIQWFEDDLRIESKRKALIGNEESIDYILNKGDAHSYRIIPEAANGTCAGTF